MAHLGTRSLPDCLHILWLFLRAGLLAGVGIYILVWLLIPEQTIAGRLVFAFIGLVIFTVIGVVQAVLCYRANKLHA